MDVINYLKDLLDNIDRILTLLEEEKSAPTIAKENTYYMLCVLYRGLSKKIQQLEADKVVAEDYNQ